MPLDDQESNIEHTTQTFIAMYNFHEQKIEKIQLLKTIYGSVSCVNFGPFDNGYLLLGLSKGVFIAFDINNLTIIMKEKPFDTAISKITFEPTNLVFVTSKEQEVIAINFIKREMHYLYVELGKK